MGNDSNQQVRSPFDVGRFVNHGAAPGYSLNAFISARSRRALLWRFVAWSPVFLQSVLRFKISSYRHCSFRIGGIGKGIKPTFMPDGLIFSKSCSTGRPDAGQAGTPPGSTR